MEEKGLEGFDYFGWTSYLKTKTNTIAANCFSFKTGYLPANIISHIILKLCCAQALPVDLNLIQR